MQGFRARRRGVFESGCLFERPSFSHAVAQDDFGYLDRERFDQLNELGKDAARCLVGLMRHLNNSKFRGRKEENSKRTKELPSPLTN